MSAIKSIYLASRSSQRRDLLTQMWINFEMLVQDSAGVPPQLVCIIPIGTFNSL